MTTEDFEERKAEHDAQRKARRLGEAALNLAIAKRRLDHWRLRNATTMDDIDNALFVLAETAHAHAQLGYNQAAKDVSLDDIYRAVEFLRKPADD